MKHTNPFKQIEKENVARFSQIGPDVPAFISASSNSSSTYNSGDSSNSPVFPSFG